MDMAQTTSNTATQPQSPRKANDINRHRGKKSPALAKSQHAEDCRFYEAIRYEHSSSAEGAALWAHQNNLADAVDYTKLPTWAANECNRRVLENLTEFPALRGELEFLGSSLAWARMNRAHVQSDEARSLAAQDPRRPAVQIEREAREKALKVFRREWGHVCHCLGFAFQWPVSGISVKYRGSAGPSKEMCLRRTVDHELGHLLDRMLAIHTVPIIRRLAIEWPYEEVTRELGEYAKKDKLEFVAVAWASFRNDPQPGLLAQTVGDKVVEQYNRRFVA